MSDGLASPEAFLFGVIGAAIGEVFTLWKLRSRKKEEWPHWAWSWLYWLPTALMILVGGVMAYLYTVSGYRMSPLVAAHIGASAPIIVGSLTAAAPDIK